MDEITVKCFMDGIDWQHHLAHDPKGAVLYFSEKALRKSVPHIETGGCGIVEVEVRLIRWVEDQDIHGKAKRPTEQGRAG